MVYAPFLNVHKRLIRFPNMFHKPHNRQYPPVFYFVARLVFALAWRLFVGFVFVLIIILLIF